MPLLFPPTFFEAVFSMRYHLIFIITLYELELNQGQIEFLVCMVECVVEFEDVGLMD